MWWISLCVCSLKEESAVLIFPSIISNPFILRFSISNPLKVSDWVEWSADTHHRSLSCPRLKERYWSSAAQIIKSIHYASLRPPALDETLMWRPGAREEWKKAHFFYQREVWPLWQNLIVLQTLQNKRFPSSETSLVAHKTFLFWAKIESSVIIYMPLCRSEPVWCCFFPWTQHENVWWIFYEKSNS